jgi:hypothetical protein
MAGAPAPRGDQRRALTRAFLARFFDNDLTARSHDLTQSFIWIMAFLAAPGFVLPVILVMWDWNVVGRSFGFDILREISRNDKLLYVGMGMVAAGLVSALVWGSVMIDRRDALVLGVQPVRGGTVIQAKLLAIVAYVVVIAAGMHVLASMTFGFMLSTGRIPLVMTGAAAHFAASFLASAFVLFSVTAAQALLMLIAGPRHLARLSALLQAGLVASMLLLMISLPRIGDAMQRGMSDTTATHTRWGVTVRPSARATPVTTLDPWLEAAPPVWFLGVYEVALGDAPPVATRLATRAFVALGLAIGLTVIGLPLAYRRLMIAAVEDPGGLGRTGWQATATERLTRATGTDPGVRATAQFLLATMGRVSRHRFIAAATLGAMLAVALPVLLRWLAVSVVADRPTADLLALPYYLMSCALVGLRVVIGIPGDLGAGWIFSATDTPPRAIRIALRRTFLALGVVPAVCLAVPMFVWWGLALAATQALLVAAMGLLLTSALLFRFEDIPCSEQLALSGQDRHLGRIGLAAAVLIWMPALPQAAPWLGRHAGALAVVLSVIAVSTLVVRLIEHHAVRPPRRPVHGAAFQTLGLD